MSIFLKWLRGERLSETEVTFFGEDLALDYAVITLKNPEVMKDAELYVGKRVKLSYPCFEQEMYVSDFEGDKVWVRSEP